MEQRDEKRMSEVDMQAALEKYEWFATARYASGAVDAYLLLPVAGYGVGSSSLKEISAEGLVRRSTAELIDSFLNAGDYKVVPRDDEVFDKSLLEEGADASAAAEDDEFVSEDLAEIYRQQGLLEQARELYVRLSLINPKKSVYFAEIISEIDRELNSINN